MSTQRPMPSYGQSPGYAGAEPSAMLVQSSLQLNQVLHRIEQHLGRLEQRLSLGVAILGAVQNSEIVENFGQFRIVAAACALENGLGPDKQRGGFSISERSRRSSNRCCVRNWITGL